MANTLAEVTPKLLAQGLMALRESCVFPRLVNSDYDAQAAMKGATIDVPIPSAIAAQAVSPGAVPPATADIAPTSASIALDQWIEAPFYMTDKDIMTAMSGTIPMQASEAIKAIANNVDSYLAGLYKSIYGAVGTAGVTPFGPGVETLSATQARTILNKQLAPLSDRRAVLDPDAEGAALGLRAFQDVSWAGDSSVMANGELSQKLGFVWHMDQNVATHVAGTLNNGSSHSAKVNDASFTAGRTTVDIDDTTLTGTVVVGDIFTVAGDTQQYVVTADATASGNAINGMSFAPAAKVAWADNAVITFVDTHVANLAFHRDCFAFATRPLADNTDGLGNLIQSAVDPVSGLALRLEVSREHKRTRFSYDILYGAACVRAELGARILG